VGRQSGSLAALLKAGRFAKQAEDLKLYRSIATTDKKAPVPKDRGAGTHLAQGSCARAQMATQSARRPARGDGEETSPSGKTADVVRTRRVIKGMSVVD